TSGSGIVPAALSAGVSLFGVRANRRAGFVLWISVMGGSPLRDTAPCCSHHPKPRRSRRSGHAPVEPARFTWTAMLGSRAKSNGKSAPGEKLVMDLGAISERRVGHGR